MDAGHDRSKRRWSCISHVLIVLALLRLQGAAAQYENGLGRNTSQSKQCAENEYPNKNGICCDKCPPGFKLTNHCEGKGLRSTCEKCRDGTYTDTTNYYHNCFKCLKCKSDELMISPCTHEKNTVCRCQQGYYKFVINSITHQCKRCKKCGKGETILKECDGEKDTECKCNYLHYRDEKSKVCTLCENCSKDCPDKCLTTIVTPPLDPTPGTSSAIVIALAVALAVTLGGSVVGLLIVLIRWFRKKKRVPLSPESPDSQKCIIKQTPLTPAINDENEKLTSHCMEYEQDQQLPDCVPREIRTHEFIYSVLDMVPINRFKELVRRLNVSEQDIDRAERDNRAFADAQYQMLKVWSDNAPGGGKNILPRPLLQEFVDRLKDMNLNGCAESIENKYRLEV